jgi:hypothetical protein
MGIENSLLHRANIRATRVRVAECIVVSGMALLQGCAVNAPSCDGRFEPINIPAPVGAGGGEEDSTSKRDHAS